MLSRKHTFPHITQKTIDYYAENNHGNYRIPTIHNDT